MPNSECTSSAFKT